MYASIINFAGIAFVRRQHARGNPHIMDRDEFLTMFSNLTSLKATRADR